MYYGTRLTARRGFNCRYPGMHTTGAQTITAIAILVLVLAALGAECAEKLDLAACIELGLKNNLQLRNEAIKVQAASAAAEGAKAIYDPQFNAEFAHSDSAIPEAGSFLSGNTEVRRGSVELNRVLPAGTMIGISASATSVQQDYASLGQMGSAFDIAPYSSKVELRVSQPLLKNAMGESNKSAIRLAEMSEAIAASVYETEYIDLRLSITRAYWDLCAAMANSAVGEEALALARSLHQSNVEKLNDNLIDETDKLATEVLVQNSIAELTRLRNTTRNAHDNLARIIRVPKSEWNDVEFKYPEASFTPAGEPTLDDAGNLTKSALLHRNDLAALRLRVKQAELDIRIKEDALDPDLNVFGSVALGSSEQEFGDTLELQDTSWAVGLRLKIPLSRTREKSEARRAQLAKEAAVNDLTTLEDAVNQECRAAARALLTARALLNTATRSVAVLEAKLALETKKYEQGRSDIRWIVQNQQELARSRMSLHIAYAEYQKARAACLAVQGTKPEGGTR